MGIIPERLFVAWRPPHVQGKFAEELSCPGHSTGSHVTAEEGEHAPRLRLKN